MWAAHPYNYDINYFIFICLENVIKDISCLSRRGWILTLTPLATPTRPSFDGVLPHPQLSPKLSGGLTEDEEEEEEGEGERTKEGRELEVFADNEADDRLSQLLMEEEMSDAHIAELALTAISNDSNEEIVQEKKVKEKQAEK